MTESSLRLVADNLDGSAAASEVLRDEVALGEGFVPRGYNVEDTVGMGVLLGAPLADTPGLLDRDVLEDRGYRLRESTLQHAWRFLAWPVPIGERRSRRPRQVHEQASPIGHAPGVGEGLVERDMAVVEARRQGADRGAAW